MNVGRVFSPLEELASRSLQVVPSLVPSQGCRVELLKKLRGHRGSDNLLDLVTRRPDVFEHHRVSILIVANRILLEVDVNCTS